MSERIDDLQLNNLKIIQNPDYFCFGIDAVLLSHFASQMKNNATVLDIGTGNGILPLLLSAKKSMKHLIGIEIQKELFELATKNIELNKLQNLIDIKNVNICDAHNVLNKEFFDTIVTNPPYKKQGSGIVNDNKFIQIAKHEIKCTLEDIIKESNYLLKDQGEIYMVHRPDRIVDILTLMRQYNIEPKIIQYVHSKISQPPVLVLIQGVKNAKPFLKTLEPIIIYKDNGEYTQKIYDIYGKEPINE